MFNLKHILISSTVIASSLSITGTALSFAETSYSVNGKSVNRNVYDAARLVSEAGQLIKQNNIDRAISVLRRALTYAPDFPAANSNLGILLARQGKNEEALSYLKKSLADSNCPAEAYANLAVLYQSTGNLDAAISTYKTLLKKFGSDYTISAEAKSTIELLERERSRHNHKGSFTPAQKSYLSEGNAKNICRWTQWHMPLKVYIEPATNLSDFPPHYEQLLRSSFYDWENASKKKVSFRFVAKKEDCDIDCYWTNDPADLGNGIENGHTQISTKEGTLAHAQITLRAEERIGAFPFSDNTVLTTCRHEIGHALGIMWHSPEASDLMYFSNSLSDAPKTISSRDLNTLLELYSKQVPIEGSLADFLSYKENWKKYGPLLTLALLVLIAIRIIQAALPKKKRGKKK